MQLRNEEEMGKLMAHFGLREHIMLMKLLIASQTAELCDIFFLDKRPILNVTPTSNLIRVAYAGASVTKIINLVKRIELSNGRIISLNQIWSVNRMPKGGFSERDLEAINIERAEEPILNTDQTTRNLVQKFYGCAADEEDKYVRRFLASQDYEVRMIAKHRDTI